MVATHTDHFPDTKLREYVWTELKTRNITKKTVGEGVYTLQHKYYPDMSAEDFGEELPKVLKKREVLEILAVGFMIDDLATENKLPEVMQFIVEKDLAQFSTDEFLATLLALMYGGIAVTNWGYLDTHKFGVAKELDNKNGTINTFSDDLASALMACCAGRVGHKVEVNSEEE